MKFRIVEKINEIVCMGRTTDNKLIILPKENVNHITLQHNLYSKIEGGSKFLKDYNHNTICELFQTITDNVKIKSPKFHGQQIKLGHDIGYFLIADKNDLDIYKEYQPVWYDSKDSENKGRKDIGEEIISVPSLVFPKEHKSELLKQFKTDIISVYTSLFNPELSTLDMSQFNEPVYIMVSMFPGGLKSRNGIQIPAAQDWDNNGIGVVLFD